VWSTNLLAKAADAIARRRKSPDEASGDAQEGRNGLIADRYESVAARSPTKLGGIIEGTRAVMENKVRTPGGQIYTLPERWQIEPR